MLKPSATPIEIHASAALPLGMPPARFLREYWQKRPLLIRRAFAHFQAPLSPEDLAGLACEDAALARLVKYDRQRDAWSLQTGPLRETDFPTLPPRDWTLLVQDVDKWDTDVAALLSAFDFLPRWRIDDVMVSFAAPGGSVGAHVDQYDVFLLQGLGRRCWEIDARPHPPLACRDDVELKLLREFHPSHRWLLEPGDMLYLPPGVPHHGVALDASLTFSIGMRAPARAELLVDLAEFLAEHLRDSERYIDPDLRAPREVYEIDARTLRRVAAALTPFAVPDAASLRTWFGRFITRYRHGAEIAPPPRPPSPATILKRLHAGARLIRHPFSRMAWARQGRSAELFVDGEAYRCSVACARRLTHASPMDAAAYAALDVSGRALLHALCARGYFAFAARSRKYP